MDLFKVVLFIFILEFCFFLDKFLDYYYYVDFFFEVVFEENFYFCLKKVVKWYLLGFYKKLKGLKKFYNFIFGNLLL